jgi:hypothetical protein
MALFFTIIGALSVSVQFMRFVNFLERRIRK